MPVHTRCGGVRRLLLGHRRLELGAADLHRLDGERLPRPRRDADGRGRQLRPARRADRDFAALPRQRARVRRRPGGRFRPPARIERAVLVGQRLAALLRESQLELQRSAVGVRVQGLRGDRRLASRQPELRRRQGGEQRCLEGARDRDEAERGALLRPRNGRSFSTPRQTAGTRGRRARSPRP